VISVVIPAFNEEKYIGPCLSAIAEASRYISGSMEVVVVDNASTDTTGSTAQTTRVIREMRKGITFARQAGLDGTTGDIVANVDADCRMLPDWLARVERSFDDPSVVAVSGPSFYYDLPWYSRIAVGAFNMVALSIYWVNHEVLGCGAMIQGGNFAVRRSAIEQIGGFDTSIEFYGEDTDIATRIAKVGRVVYDWTLYMPTSGRRLATEGVIRTGLVYALNYFSTTFWGEPVTKTHTDIRSA
jgi:glycosyltransferase involved in cell wall biosynthesis